MRYRLVAVFCLVFASLLAPLAVAQTVDSPGRAEVPVTDGSEAARTEAVAEAVDQVILRLSGDPSVLTSDLAAELQRNADRYLQGYAYREAEDTESGSGGLRLIARFDIQRLREALVEAEVPIWPDRPPTVLVWLGRDLEGEREIVGAGDDEPLRAEWVAAAKDLGINLFFPIMDLQDLSAVRFVDLAGGFSEPVAEASERYGADQILAGRIADTDGGRIDGRWMVLSGQGDVERWREQASDPAALLDRTLDSLVTRLRETFAYLPDLQARGRMQIEVAGIVDLGVHERVTERLTEMSGVERVNPVRVQEDVVQFELAISTTEARVMDALERDGRLAGSDAEYRWE
ncbi:hypothetical protein SPISAL_02535 [Spiribacter salinus M19-40]|uniref:DUF2066 domain-containing protein n=1 Tax=Spiribacter salinus M19-40 TaxID=1260251 RepID=R4VJ50_9GAMM|nr:DUF2066 domain-containing protein [Spiribacter salinus]AGM40602.1 hypothetical protein SPISAL_02535 [Spiribacter salinus M19-40]